MKCLLLFVKYPKKGLVKSRLAADLGTEAACRLYKCFVLDILKTAKSCRWPVKIFYSPPDSGAGMGQMFGNNYKYAPQLGIDLGERMKNAFDDTFSEGFSETVLIGSDIPDMTPGLIDEAFTALNTHDAVMGPAPDGGYYLIGFRKSTFLPEIFHGIEWSTDTVFDSTMRVFMKHGLGVHVLPEWSDVDRIDDLKALYDRSRDREFRDSKTMAMLNIFLNDGQIQL